MGDVSTLLCRLSCTFRESSWLIMTNLSETVMTLQDRDDLRTFHCTHQHVFLLMIKETHDIVLNSSCSSVLFQRLGHCLQSQPQWAHIPHTRQKATKQQGEQEWQAVAVASALRPKRWMCVSKWKLSEEGFTSCCGHIFVCSFKQHHTEYSWSSQGATPTRWIRVFTPCFVWMLTLALLLLTRAIWTSNLKGWWSKMNDLKRDKTTSCQLVMHNNWQEVYTVSPHHVQPIWIISRRHCL